MEEPSIYQRNPVGKPSDYQPLIRYICCSWVESGGDAILKVLLAKFYYVLDYYGTAWFTN